MEQILNFLKDNFFLICVLVVCLILLLLVAILYPKKFSYFWSSLLEVLPVFISDCENKGIVGAENKLNYVMDLSFAYLSSLSGVKFSVLKSKYENLLKSQIEAILATPQKKEGVNNVEKN